MRDGVLKILILLTVFAFASWPAAAAQNDHAGMLTIDLADDHVDITTGFNGARLALFGVKEHEGDIAIVIEGPDKEMVVRRKSQIFGMWMNTESVVFRHVPAYYDFALSAGEKNLAGPEILRAEGIGLDSLTFDHKGREKPATVETFKEALIRNKQGQGLFPLDSKDIYFLNGDFFRANFYLPADVPTGDYTIRTFLFDKGKLIGRRDVRLRVAQVGFNARLYHFAFRSGLLYGVVAVFLAVFTGWAAYMFWRKE